MECLGWLLYTSLYIYISHIVISCKGVFYILSYILIRVVTHIWVGGVCTPTLPFPGGQYSVFFLYCPVGLIEDGESLLVFWFCDYTGILWD